VCKLNCGIAVAALHLFVQATSLDVGIHAGHALVAAPVGAGDKGMLAVPFVMSRNLTSGGDVPAGHIRALDHEAVELVGDDTGIAELLLLEVERLPVDGAHRLDFSSLEKTG